jgi:mono/diheme cytochrome c family protein
MERCALPELVLALFVLLLPGGLAIADEEASTAEPTVKCGEAPATDAEADGETTAVDTDAESEPPEAIEGEALALLYEENCAFCHGYDGIPILPGAPNFAEGERLEKCNAALLVTMKTGKNDMPPWEDVLSLHEQRQLLNFVRRFVSGEE